MATIDTHLAGDEIQRRFERDLWGATDYQTGLVQSENEEGSWNWFWNLFGTLSLFALIGNIFGG